MVAAAIVASPLMTDGAPMRRVSVKVASAALRAIGLRPKILGASNLPQGPCVYVANHASYLDAIVLLTALHPDTRFVIKGEFERVPVLGHLMHRCDHVLIDRQSAEKSLAGLGELAVRIGRGESLVLFPEGTFTHEAGLRPFKLGAFRLAAEAGVPIVPLVLRGTRTALRDGARLPRHTPIEVEVLRPLRPEGTALADIVRLRDHAADAIAARLGEPRLHAVMVAGLGGT
jgi:fatty-acyl-CoA synthase